ncbi:hypothetical protein SEA_LILPHARAOH_63 [Mycobacterium phage LilPharaoh]|uniref:DUF7246 domain-containing protein n=1 Tax=Mycobacterium phage Amelie TaxID=1913035 RepID=A0A1J0GQ52_9CAUD|nr:hypothetical protein AVV01_gp64 [Mycobacterium phage Enkosi]YP_009952580.1 hypothetical protein I5G92_gp62 [Mycobacterium phage Amelie]ATN90516.1 hypothetical protein SEA_LILPHARAOH_63 [Mycobacterium phage LilPharaoh]AVP42640.1 hypothetical protein SEA_SGTBEANSPROUT_63 [Mycobacterium phage SgtBeansprout]AXC37168.1 hypothetical protein SEA_BIGLEBOPS_62 [Mycobacterium phage Biglebops]QGJ93347.1 hypothetical protein PBI_MDAVU_63 [Mycobacterium phage Mdavu]UQS94462.1 hypothetical protein SEA_N
MKRMKAFRSSVPPVPQPEVVVNGRVLAPGTEVSIRGERGRFRFVKAAVTSAGRITCDFIGPDDNTKCWRSFYPERIKTVHRVNRTRANVA